MSLAPDIIKNIATLARIAIGDDETEQLAHSLSDIVDLVKQMQKVDTTGVEPMSHPLDLAQRQRDDVITETDQHELFQQCAPQTEAGLYLVPQVIGVADSSSTG